MVDDKLIDKYLPRYSFNEYHEIVINSSIEKVYKAAKDFDLSKSKLIKWLFKLRGLPTNRMNLQGFISDIGFNNIEEKFPVSGAIRNKMLQIIKQDSETVAGIG